MNWLKKFMAGRYGSDQLSIVLVFISAVLIFISGFSAKLSTLSYLSFIFLSLSIFRMFSKNINKRRMENYKLSIFVSPIYSWFIKKIHRLKDAKTYKYFDCPNCKLKLRLPKGKGKISITCPKCRTEFIGKT
jgi:hypothetical protein